MGIGGAAEAAASAEKSVWTFNGWDARSLALMPGSRGENFPAFLMRKGAIDKALMDLMRPLHDAGLRPARFRSLLVELHTKRHTHRAIQHEEEVKRRKALGDTGMKMFSDFGDPLLYAGHVPSVVFLARCYRAFHDTIASFMDREVCNCFLLPTLTHHLSQV